MASPGPVMANLGKVPKMKADGLLGRQCRSQPSIAAQRKDGCSEKGDGIMTGLLWVVFLVLLVLWLIGFAVNWGAFIWILLVLAIVALLINVIGGATRTRGL